MPSPVKARHFFSRPREPTRRRNLISLTPLIDVVFILLLFFMLASSFADLHSIVLSPPASGTGKPSFEGALLVEVRLDGVRYAGRYISIDDLVARVRKQVAAHPARRVLVRPAASVDLQSTVRVLDALSAAGVRRLALMDAAGANG